MFFYTILTKTISEKRRPEFEVKCCYLPPTAGIKNMWSFISNPSIFHGVAFKQMDIQNEGSSPSTNLLNILLIKTSYFDVCLSVHRCITVEKKTN